ATLRLASLAQGRLFSPQAGRRTRYREPLAPRSGERVTEGRGGVGQTASAAFFTFFVFFFTVVSVFLVSAFTLLRSALVRFFRILRADLAAFFPILIPTGRRADAAMASTTDAATLPTNSCLSASVSERQWPTSGCTAACPSAVSAR